MSAERPRRRAAEERNESPPFHVALKGKPSIASNSLPHRPWRHKSTLRAGAFLLHPTRDDAAPQQRGCLRKRKTVGCAEACGPLHGGISRTSIGASCAARGSGSPSGLDLCPV